MITDNQKKITFLALLFTLITKAQQPILIKDVTSSLQPTGSSVAADLNHAKWNGKVFFFRYRE